MCPWLSKNHWKKLDPLDVYGESVPKIGVVTKKIYFPLHKSMVFKLGNLLIILMSIVNSKVFEQKHSVSHHVSRRHLIMKF